MSTEATPKPPTEESKPDVAGQEQGQEAHTEGSEQEKELTPEEKLGSLEKDLKEHEGDIAALRQKIEERKAELAKVREELGLPPLADDPALGADAERLGELENEQRELNEKKEEILSLKDLNDLLQLLKKLSPEEQQDIMKTGLSRDGKPLKTNRGDVNPEIAKKIAEAAFKGAKEVTEIMIKAFIALVGGVLAGIFSGLKGGGAAGNSGGEGAPAGK